MKPRVTFPDGEGVLRTYLTALWSARSETYKPTAASITNSAPRGALAAGATHLQIELDGTPSSVDYPVTERGTYRFTFWSDPKNQGNAKNGASITEAFVYSHPGDADVFSTVLLTGRLKGFDPDTRNNFVSFTARVNLRPTAL